MRPWRYLGRSELEVLDDGPERERRDERERADQDHGADQEADEERRVGRQRPGARRDVFFFASEPAIASTGTITQ